MSAIRHVPSSLLLLGACLLAPACLDVEVDDSGELTPAPQVFRNGDMAEQAEAAGCVSERIIARLGSEGPLDCPAVPGWQVSKLFDEGTPWLTNHAIPFTAPDGQFCVYRWDEASGMSLGDAYDELAALNTIVCTPEGQCSVPELAAYDADCEGVEPQTSLLSDSVGAELREIFRDHVSAIDPAWLPQAPQDVVVAVVDTMPMSQPANPRSKHGPAMMSIIEDLACGTDTGCTVDVQPILALPRYWDGVDVSRGGVAGAQTDLAISIWETVERWREATGGDPAVAKLVINLSIGWDGDAFGSLADPRTGVDAVQTALEYASCYGALIVAAAGNDNDLCSTGALYPAAWEAMEAPDQGRCYDLGVTADVADFSAGYRPLVYAVGGLHVTAPELMPGSRVGGVPRLTAPGTQVVAGASASQRTAGHTGTSVAAAAVSGVAAALWSQLPGYSAHDLMDVIYGSGQSLGMNADFYYGAAPPTIRRLGMCQAFDAVIPGPPLPCSWSGPADLSNVVDTAIDLTELPIHTASFTQSETCNTFCAEESGPQTVGQGTNLCDSWLNPTGVFVTPQPNDPPCPTCPLTSANDVRVSLNEVYKLWPIDWVTVTVDDGESKVRFLFDDPTTLALIEPGSVIALKLDANYLPINPIKQATIDFKFTDPNFVISNELIIE